MKNKINLISDTVTKPTPAMLEAMFTAEVGDDVFKQDPSVNALEAKAAALFGKEAALFCPSGTMTNQIAIKLHTQPGQQVICDQTAHIYRFEGGGIAFNSSCSVATLEGDRGRFTAEQAEARINDPDFIHAPRTALISMENTTNVGGGACWDLNEMRRVKKMAESHGLPVHLDGARIFNAAVAENINPKAFGEVCDTLSVCLSKGLGAPVGSLVLGSKAHIKDAMQFRKNFGGAMRQSGYLAAAGSYALDHHIEKLREDHKRAATLAQELESKPWVKEVLPTATNIVIFHIHEDVNQEALISKLEEQGILLIGLGKGILRMVTHLDFTDDMLEQTLQALRRII